MLFRIVAGAVCLCVWTQWTVAQDPSTAAVEQLLADLNQYKRNNMPDKQRISFELPEAAVNAYLKRQRRPGVESVSVKLLAGNKASVDLSVDFRDLLAAVENDRKPIFNSLKRLQLDVTFTISNSKASFKIDRASVDGKTTDPPAVLEMVQLLASNQPEKFDATRPIPIPFGLKRLQTQDGLLLGDTR